MMVTDLATRLGILYANKLLEKIEETQITLDIAKNELEIIKKQLNEHKKKEENNKNIKKKDKQLSSDVGWGFQTK